MRDLKELLTVALHDNQLTCSDAQQEQLINYLELMQRWNAVFNLTSITTPREMVYLHLIDSLLMQPYLHGTQLLDVGSGAGLPGIPLAIMMPEKHWTLLDKNNKKTRFMTQAVAELGLKNVVVVQERSENFKPAERFDSIVSRAYGSLQMFVATCAHLLAKDGLFVAMKGKHPEEELASLSADYMIREVIPIHIKGVETERCVILIAANPG